MSDIKFQEDEADRVYAQLFGKNQNRYLLADEVGLGKTVTAARVIAKLVEDNNGKTINIGYICGNKALAIQNIKKLRERIVERNSYVEIEDRAAENLSLGFLTLANGNGTNNAKTRVVIHVVTPSTTIKVISDGTVKERAYAYHLLTGDTISKDKKFEPSDVLLWEICQGRAEEKKLFKELKAITEVTETFSHKFKELLENEWKKVKETCFNKCIEESLKFDLINDNYKYAVEYILKEKADYFKLRIFNNYSLKKFFDAKNCKVSDNDKRKIEEFINNLSQDFFYGVKVQKDEVKDYYKGIIAKLQKNEKKKRLRSYFGKILELVKQEAWTSNTIKEINKQCGNDAPDNNNNDINVQVLEMIKKAFSDTCIKEYIRLARKCMAVASVEIMKMDLFVADEIQNYSELFNTIKGNSSELGLVINKIIQGEQKLLLMSATPFRYHSHLNMLENYNKDKDADDNDNEENTVKEKELESGVQHYLENESDIYDEFKMIVKYLNGEFCFNCWKNLSVKKELYIQGEVCEEAKNKCKDVVKKQSQMLLNSNISRVERFMSGVNNDFITKNKTIDIDEIYLRELLSLPQNTLDWVTEEYADDAYYFSYNGEWYCKAKDKFWKVQNWDWDEYGAWYFNEGIVEELDNKDETKLKAELKMQLDNNNLRLDYIKSTPAMYSFSGGYKSLENKMDMNSVISIDRVNSFETIFALKNKDKCGENKFKDSKDKPEVNDKSGLLYNARVAKLFNVLFDEEELHKLLFIPSVRTCENRKLKGVYENKLGTSKRLFFTDYQMTPKSLSVILTYEASRRARNDLLKRFDGYDKILCGPCCEEALYLGVLYNYSGRDENKGKSFDIKNKETVNIKELVDLMYDIDKKVNSNDTKVNYGSPYSYAKNRKKLFDDDKQIDIFCKAYFKYMCSASSLRVILAYCSGENPPKSIYEAIIQYGIDGCIWDVFDEYSEYIVKDRKKNAEESFAEAFTTIIDILPVGVNVKGKSNTGNDYKKMETDFAFGHYAGAKDNTSTAKTLERKIRRFNSPFRPFNFISTSIGQEGFDFHIYCRKIVHWSLEYNPVKFEQREGRVNRYQGYANRLKLSKYIDLNKIMFENWKEAFNDISEFNKKITEDSKGLFPCYAVPYNTITDDEVERELERECYYYQGSFEDVYFERVLQTVGYYRSLLGQSGNDTFEEAFRSFIKGMEHAEIKEYFINLYPQN